MRPQAEFGPYEGPGHELGDVKIRGIILFTLGLLVMAIVVHFATGALMSRFGNEARTLAKSRPSRFDDDKGQFPAPRLQADPARDMAAFRQRESETLANYGWADRKAGVARLPIDRAIDILVKRGLPARPANSGEVAPSGSH